MDNLMTDEIIKRRLLIDGDGVGDDRRLLTLIKDYVSWATGPAPSSPSPLISQLHGAEESGTRTHQAIQVNLQARAIFIHLKDTVAHEIGQTKRQILDSKVLLEEATKHRKYSMEYDALAKLIQSKPDRKGTDRRRIALQTDLSSLRSRQGKLDCKLEERKKNLSMMSSTMERLKDLLGESEEDLEKSTAKTQSPPPEESSPPRPATPPLDPTPDPPPHETMDTSPPSSPTLQSTDQLTPGQLEPVSGIVTAAPTTPPPHPKTKSEKYEDLSESEGEQA